MKTLRACCLLYGLSQIFGLMPNVSSAQSSVLVKEAEAGNAAAQYKLAQYYNRYFSEHRKSPDFTKEDVIRVSGQAIVWLQKSAESGYRDAQIELAGIYRAGFWTTSPSGSYPLVESDPPKALRWYLAAAHQGSHKAEYCLSLMYENGEGTPEDSREALYWARKSAEGGDVVGEANLGRAYRDGALGLSQSYEKAKFWYKKAAAQAASGNEREQIVGNSAKEDLAELERQIISAAPPAVTQSSRNAKQQTSQTQSVGINSGRQPTDRVETLPVASASADAQRSQPIQPRPTDTSTPTVPAAETLGGWSSYQSTFVSPLRDGNDNNVIVPFGQSVSVSNGRLQSWLHEDAQQPVGLNFLPSQNWRNEVDLISLDPSSVSLTRPPDSASCPISVCVYVETQEHRDVVSWSICCDYSNGSEQRRTLVLAFPDTGTAQQAAADITALISKYRRLGSTAGPNRPPQPYWFAYVFSDGSAPIPVAGWCSSNNDFDRIQAKNCALSNCVQQTGNSFTCHESQDYRVVQHVWVAGAQNAQGNHGFAAADTQDASESKASSNCNPFGGCQISFSLELFPK
jgi:TPR repeat protein